MKLTILVDNNTLIDQYYLGEPGVSYWIEADNKNILFDVGYSDIFIRNATGLKIDLKRTDFLILSHGHLDHTWGLEPLIDWLGKKTNDIELIAHPNVFDKKIFKGFGEIGSRKRTGEIVKYFRLNLSKNPFWLTENLYFLGEIPRVNDFENKAPIGVVINETGEQPDYVIDDSAIVYKSDEGLIIITGCSHAGICNIIEYAKQACDEERILDIIGGFHLQNANKELLEQTIKYLQANKIQNIHPCHCVDLPAKVELGKVFQLEEIGVGSIFEFYEKN